jgi:uracil-DNA glycosylase family 4
MAYQTDTDEVLSITGALKEHVQYFNELGIQLVEPSAISPPAVTKTAELATVASPRIPVSETQRSVPSPAAEPIRSPIKKRAGSETVLFTDLGPGTEQLTPSQETFEAIHAEIGDCTRCPLHAGRTNVVHTEGDRKARLMFVGEAPGADEDAQARPFVGRAGQLLTKIIEAIGFKRDEVLIGNINRCRPPGNRPPTAEEAAVCKPFLLREIASVQPEVIVVMGNTAVHNLLETKEGITRLRGRFHNYKGVPVMPTFHPAYLLRDPSKKRETWEDLKKVRDFLDERTQANN